MPQGLPKKIQVGLLLPDLALKLGNPTPRRRPFIQYRAPHRQHIKGPLPRTTGTPQPFQSSSPYDLLPLVQALAVNPEIGRHRTCRFARRQPRYRSSLKFLTR
ncbi:MAG: hypothetical protein U1E23_04465 [Reyranellaceae bacterium]